jgi:replicative DNA helicase
MAEYNPDLQKLFLELMLHDPHAFVRVQNIFNTENFDKSLQKAATFIKEHAESHSTMPTVQQVNAKCGTKLTKVEEFNDGHLDWFLTEFEQFTKRYELERAILKAADMIEKGDYSPVEKLVKDAVQISLTKDLGTLYAEDPIGRLSKIRDNNGQLSTGWSALDAKLYGGFNRGELNIFAGGSGSGKSLFMQNIAVNWMLAGLTGVYITLELSEELCSMRIDSMVSEVPSREILKSADDVALKVKMKSRSAGDLWVKYMPAQSTINDIRSYLKELQIQKGCKLDFIMVDYLDLLMPVSVKVNPNDQFIKDKYVSEELRNLSKELGLLLVTASQLNRSAVEEIELDHSHIAGGISKINTADNVFAIYTSRSMRERGQYQLQLIKTRSSSGVGSKVDLAFNIDTLRITDMFQADSDNGAPNSAIYAKIKQSAESGATTTKPSSIASTQSTAKISGNVQSAKLAGMIASLKGNSD